jgi:hypothetical protein
MVPGYTIYKNCTDDEFILIKKELTVLQQKVLNRFLDKLYLRPRADDNDSLTLNFYIKGEELLQGNICFLFEDLPLKQSFKTGLIKWVDIKNRRYCKRIPNYKSVTLDELKIEIESIVQQLLDVYYSWNYETVVNSKYTVIAAEHTKYDLSTSEDDY